MTKLALFSVVNPLRECEVYLPPLGLAYIASYLREHMHFNDTVILHGSRDPIRELAKHKPDLLGVSSVTQNFEGAKNLAGKIESRFDIPIIIGGPHVSGFQTMPSCFDVGVLGEGEETMSELVDAYERHGLDKNKLKEIRGIVFHDHGKTVTTEGRRPIRPLDGIPLPARELLEIRRATHMFTSRGCPYRCVFCSSSRLWRSPRFFTPERVVDEMKVLIGKHRVEKIHIYDDLFTVNRQRLRRIVRLVREEKIDEEATFSCLARADMVDEEICRLLKDMNVVSVQFGFESGSERVLAYLKQGTVTVEQNRRAIEVCKKHGLSVFGSFIVGSPNETRGDIMATLDFIRNSRIDGGTVYPLIPFPGTEVWRHARERGLVSDHMDWSKLDMEFYNPEQSITLTDKIDGKEFQELYTEIQRELATLLIGCFSGIPPRIHSRVSNVLDSQPKIFGLA